jgi:hypothetical protein
MMTRTVQGMMREIPRLLPLPHHGPADDNVDHTDGRELCLCVCCIQKFFKDQFLRTEGGAPWERRLHLSGHDLFALLVGCG